MTQTLEPGTYTALPFSQVETDTFAPLQGDEIGRVLIRPYDPDAVMAEDWQDTIDQRTGKYIQMRRTSCGISTCRCATEVRLK